VSGLDNEGLEWGTLRGYVPWKESFLQSGLPIGDDDELGAIVLASADRQDAAIFGYVHWEALAHWGFNQLRNLACFARDQV